MKALWEDTEIVDLLSTLFHNEFQQGAATVANSEQVATSDSPDERPEVPSKRRCQVDGCSNVLVSKGRCIRHGGGGRCIVEGCDTSSKRGGLRLKGVPTRWLSKLDEIPRTMLDAWRRQAMWNDRLRKNSSSRRPLLGTRWWQKMRN
ncbi:hypothetical protein Ae201684_018914 [Aphanomyces euteiches]|uniref:WRKY19-like zinc finger domain-containing protein n=1 Tax=Aphanomyces euteiches TaxID=100861 RepID=A0A6G0W470_9STRA|nr:hypothetical protein Ae201684_018914 [Aphanomyces euteiches]